MKLTIWDPPAEWMDEDDVERSVVTECDDCDCEHCDCNRDEGLDKEGQCLKT